MGENQNIENVTVNENGIAAGAEVIMPEMQIPEVTMSVTPKPEFGVSTSQQVMQELDMTMQTGQMVAPNLQSVMPKPEVNVECELFKSKEYQMVLGEKTKFFERYELMKIQNPKDAAEIENYVKNFNYIEHPEYIQKFGAKVLGKNSIKETLQYIEEEKNEEAYSRVKEHLVALMKDMEKPAKKPWYYRILKIVDDQKAKAEVIKLEKSRIDEIFDGVGKKISEEYELISNEYKKKLQEVVETEQKYAISIDKYVIAGEFILKSMLEDYLLPAKKNYELDTTNTQNLVAYKTAEQRVTAFVSNLNDVITMSTVTLLGAQELLWIQETGNNMELYLKRIVSVTLPLLARQSLTNILKTKYDIPLEEAKQIERMTGELLLDTAKETGSLYLESLEHSTNPALSVDVMTQLEQIMEETTKKAEEIKSNKVKKVLELHEKLSEINDKRKLSLDTTARSILTPEQLDAMQKTADNVRAQLE